MRIMPVPAITLAAAAAGAAVATQGVARLDSGPAGTVATYGGGQRVRGVRLRDGETPEVHVHLVLTLDRPIPQVTAEIREAVRSALELVGDTGRAVHLHVADVLTEPEIAGELPAVTEDL
jgi:uncharacterized alkaline shock family protein YloU